MTGIRNLDSWLRRMREDVAGLEVPQDLAERFGPYRDDPTGFATQVLGIDRIPGYQRAVMRDVAEAERVSWVAGHATGKSYAAALLLAWYLLTRPGCRCLITSATFERQVGRVIFSKLRTLAAAAPEPLPLEVFATRAHVAGFPEWSAEGVPATKPGNFAGFHSDRMLVIADEAKALDRAVFEELHGVLASARNEARLLLLSTAGPAEGYFYDAFARRQELWKLHRTPSTESPFATGYAKRMREECLGEHDPVFRMRVLAEFAEDVEGQLIPISAIHAAIDREFDDTEDEKAATVLGCDIARFGDDRSVVCVRKGRRVVELKSWRGADLMTTADRICSLINAHKARARIDSCGIGAGTLDQLRRLDHGSHVDGINVAERASKPETFANLRAEIGWRLRQLFEQGEIAIPDDPGLVSELAALRYEYDSRGRIKLESKDTAKARLGRSPDLADSLMLAFGTPPSPPLRIWWYDESPDDVKPQPLQVPAEGYFGPGTRQLGRIREPY